MIFGYLYTYFRELLSDILVTNSGSNVENRQVINATPGVLVESVASKDIVRCARVNVSGLSRLKIGSYSSAHRITLVPSDSIHEKSHKKIQICLHRSV